MGGVLVLSSRRSFRSKLNTFLPPPPSCPIQTHLPHEMRDSSPPAHSRRQCRRIPHSEPPRSPASCPLSSWWSRPSILYSKYALSPNLLNWLLTLRSSSPRFPNHLRRDGPFRHVVSNGEMGCYAIVPNCSSLVCHPTVLSTGRADIFCMARKVIDRRIDV